MMNTSKQKLKVAIHKFSSCDGCQLAFINSGERLLQLTELVDIVHFVEAGPINEEMAVDLAFVEGSISTSEEEKRIKAIRANSQYLIAHGSLCHLWRFAGLRNFE